MFFLDVCYPVRPSESDILTMTSFRYITVVKNPLSPIEHPGGIGVNNELFEESLEQFVVCIPRLRACVARRGIVY